MRPAACQRVVRMRIKRLVTPMQGSLTGAHGQRQAKGTNSALGDCSTRVQQLGGLRLIGCCSRAHLQFCIAEVWGVISAGSLHSITGKFIPRRVRLNKCPVVCVITSMHSQPCHAQLGFTGDTVARPASALAMADD